MKKRNFLTKRRFGLLLIRIIAIVIIFCPGFTALYAQSGNSSDDKSIVSILQIIGLIGSLSTIILGLIAIWLSLYFYRRTNELNNMVSNKLTTIEVSSKVTETTSMKILQPIIEGMMTTFKQTTRTGVDNLRDKYMNKIASEISNLASATTDAEKKKAKDSIFQEINAMFGTFMDKIEEISFIPSTSTALEGKDPANSFFGIPKIKWSNFIQRIEKLEEGREFLSVKWLRETIFKNDSDSLELLQKAIHSRILEKYYINNPKNPKFPTSACKIDRNNQFVKQIISQG